ncbi:OmpH family outer membrane protein [Shimia sp.]|uniref:OmpH family outer membrane protein n=1 Tax=Shimia sp. TaxID=1954381 RepID=UPI0035675AD9
MLRPLFRLLRACLLIVLTAGTVAAQEAGPRSPVLTIESERLFADSAFGQRVAREIEAERSVLLAENRKIESDLTAEEKRLTDMRKTMSPEDFRAVADAFDARVDEIRKAQDTKARAIGERREREQAEFLKVAGPVLARLLQETGADVILERRSVFFSLDMIDITGQAIEELDRVVGDGARSGSDP